MPAYRYTIKVRTTLKIVMKNDKISFYIFL